MFNDEFCIESILKLYNIYYNILCILNEYKFNLIILHFSVDLKINNTLFPYSICTYNLHTLIVPLYTNLLYFLIFF